GGFVRFDLYRGRNSRSLFRHDFHLVFTWIQEQCLGEITEFVGVAAILVIDIDSREFIGTDRPQAAEWRLGKRQRRERLAQFRLLSALISDFVANFLVPWFTRLNFWLAGRARILRAVRKIGSGAEILPTYETPAAPGLTFR